MDLVQVATAVIAESKNDPALAARVTANLSEVIAERIGITTAELLQQLDDDQLNEIVGGIRSMTGYPGQLIYTCICGEQFANEWTLREHFKQHLPRM